MLWQLFAAFDHKRNLNRRAIIDDFAVVHFARQLIDLKTFDFANCSRRITNCLVSGFDKTFQLLTNQMHNFHHRHNFLYKQDALPFHKLRAAEKCTFKNAKPECRVLDASSLCSPSYLKPQQ